MPKPSPSTAEMDRIRAADAIEVEKRRKAFKPEPNEFKALVWFQVGRYTKGSFRGLFIVHQMMLDENTGETSQKVLAEGVDVVVAMAAIETALRKRVFK